MSFSIGRQVSETNVGIVFQTEIEFTPDCFTELTDVQREAYERKGVGSEPVYRVIPLEPSVSDWTEDKVTVGLTVVTES